MMLHVYLMVAVALLGGPTDALLREDADVLITAEAPLAHVDTLCLVLETRETPLVASLIDVAEVRTRIARLLEEDGVKVVECRGDVYPRLVVLIEGMSVPDCDRYVYRVQTSLNRLLIVPDRPSVQIEGAVWRLRPVMKVVAAPDAGQSLVTALHTQVEAFIGARAAARKLLSRTTTEGPDTPNPETPVRTQVSPRNLEGLPSAPFVASRSSSVFHRPDCRWVQNVTEANRVEYRTRDEALQAGKRPCKSCKP